MYELERRSSSYIQQCIRCFSNATTGFLAKGSDFTNDIGDRDHPVSIFLTVPIDDLGLGFLLPALSQQPLRLACRFS